MAATAISLAACQSSVIAILQAAQATASWPTTVDGTVLQYASDAQILSAILYADAEVCNAIITTPGQPYQYGFALTSAALSSGDTIPARNGLILKVQTLNTVDTGFTSADVSTTNDTISVYPSYCLDTGTRVQFSTTGVLPTGIFASINYYAVRVATVDATRATFAFAGSRQNAFAGIIADITNAGSGSSTIIAQYEDGVQAKSKDEILGAKINPNIYGTTLPAITPFWFVEGDVIYTPASTCKVVYCDYTKTSIPQAPEPYTNAVIAGAVANLMEDGMDQAMAGYYQQIFENAKAMIRGGASEVPAIAAYKG